MFSFIEGDLLRSFDSADDFASELSKALYGTRDFTESAMGVYNLFCFDFPGQVPVIFDDGDGIYLFTGSYVREQIEAEKRAKIEAKIRARKEWQDASPMAQAMKAAGLA